MATSNLHPSDHSTLLHEPSEAGQDKQQHTPERSENGTVAVDGEKEVDAEKAEKSDASPVNVHPDFPEGGLQGWLTVFGAFLVLFASFGYVNAFGVFQSYYQMNQFANETSSNISWIGSIQLFLQFALAAVSGKLFDMGYFRVLLASGSIIYCLGIFLTSIAKTYWQAMITQGIIMGLGLGLMFLPSLGVVGHYFHRRRGIAMGITVVGSSLGGVIFPIMLNRLFVNIGFSDGVRASGYLILGCLVIANIIMKPRLSGRKKGSGTPPPSPKAMFSEPVYALTSCAFFFVAWGLFLPFFFLQVFCEAHHLSENISFYSLAILNAASIFGRTIPNALADRFGSFNLQLFCCTGSSIILFAMFGATTPAGAIVFAILYGFFSGGYVSLLSPVLASTASHVSEIGIRIGLSMILISFAALSGTPISGALLARSNGAFYAPIIFAGVSMFIGTALLATARTLQAKKKGTWKV